MRAFQSFLSDDSGQGSVEYAFVFLIFAFAVIFGMYAVQNKTGGALINTRARMVCNSVTLRSNVVASTDAAGNITCQ